MKINKDGRNNKIREKMDGFTRHLEPMRTYMGFLELKNRKAGLENSVNGFSEGLETEKEKLSELEVRM